MLILPTMFLFCCLDTWDNIKILILPTSVSDPYHFDADPDPDPDPRIRFQDDGSGSGSGSGYGSGSGSGSDLKSKKFQFFSSKFFRYKV